MPSILPDGEPAPADGALPPRSLAEVGTTPFGIYLHVPFCATRCGYCDFNTYTADELSGEPGASRASWADAAITELALARRVLGDRDVPISTVFIGGGTPTLLAPSELGRVVKAIDTEFGLVPDAEITTEANPETVSPHTLEQLRAAGFTRLSIGMQSAVPHVLDVLDRVHTPGRPAAAVAEARDAGFEHISVDLIYGTPGESLEEWRTSLDAVIGAGPDHVSAYALIVEDGTRLAAQIRRGEIASPDGDDQADKYELADDVLHQAGFAWYEVSNWARTHESRCRHNELYWTGGHWWGIGPGAHSHIGGTRWWNVKHPAAWAARLAAKVSPAHAREVLDGATWRMERILLETRLSDGLDVAVLDDVGRDEAATLVADGLLDATALAASRVVLTRRGRLLADAVVRRLTD